MAAQGEATMSPRIPVENMVFKGTRILFDGHSWRSCTFDDCEIIIEYGEFDAISCSFDKCHLNLRGSALGIARIIQLFYRDTPIWFAPEEKFQDVLEKMRQRLIKEGMLEKLDV